VPLAPNNIDEGTTTTASIKTKSVLQGKVIKKRNYNIILIAILKL